MSRRKSSSLTITCLLLFETDAITASYGVSESNKRLREQYTCDSEVMPLSAHCAEDTRFIVVATSSSPFGGVGGAIVAVQPIGIEVASLTASHFVDIPCAKLLARKVHWADPLITASMDAPEINIAPALVGVARLPDVVASSRIDARDGNVRDDDVIVIGVQGIEYVMPGLRKDAFSRTLKLMGTYAPIISSGRSPVHLPVVSANQLRVKLQLMEQQFSRASNERAALEYADNYDFPADVLARDGRLLRELGSLEALIVARNDAQKVEGINLERVHAYLRDDVNYTKICDIVHTGVVIDVDPEFVVRERTEPYRNMQLRLLPLYRKSVAELHAQEKVLLLRVSELTSELRAQINFANEYHWRPEPGKVAGRPLLDCSNCAPEFQPLNTEGVKLRGIARYQFVNLPQFFEILLRWDKYRRARNLKWSDMWMFKEDVKGCFNHLHWSPATVRLMGFMLEDDILMLMLTCGFGVSITPMVWSTIGDALKRAVNKISPVGVDAFVDDFMGAGTLTDTVAGQLATQNIVTGVLGAEGISVKKSILAQCTEILGILTDFVKGTVRPKDKAIEKLFYVLFSIDSDAPQPLVYWQCLSSLTNMYSHFLRGARPFVDPILHMLKRTKPHMRSAATASAKFAIQIWRVIVILAMFDPDAVSVPISLYLGVCDDTDAIASVSDASPYAVCSALYHPASGVLLAWSWFLWPFDQDMLAQHQGHREYLGNLFTQLLLIVYTSRHPSNLDMYYQWVNDNVGAIQWVASNKCSSLSVQYACLATTQFMMNAPIYMVPPAYKPGVEMGDIDTMSRIRLRAGETPTHPRHMRECQSLLPAAYIALDDPLIHALFNLLDPSVSVYRDCERDHHNAYMTVSDLTTRIINKFLPRRL